MIIGYARVSTDAQDYKGQETALLAAGASKVFAEKISGVVTEAPARAIDQLGPGRHPDRVASG
jgi:DNA invertase Pin-like site-specific DNA recombinase